MKITFRWVERHGSGCPLAGVAVCGLPTCAQGSSVPPPVVGVCWESVLFAGPALALILGTFCWLSRCRVSLEAVG